MMKQLAIITMILSASLLCNAQDPQSQVSVNATLGYGTDVSYIYYNGQATDTIGIGDSTWTYVLRAKSKFKLQPEVYLSLDSTGGTANAVTINLYSKTFGPANYVLRETDTWFDGSDTTLIMSSDSSHISEFWKVELIGTDDTFKAKMDQLIIKMTEDRQ